MPTPFRSFMPAKHRPISQTLVAITLSTAFVTARAQPTSFGIGLEDQDSVEIVRYVATESMANDYDLNVSDTIIAVDGRSPREFVRSLDEIRQASKITLHLRKAVGVKQITIPRTRRRKSAQPPTLMLDKSVGQIPLGSYGADDLDQLDRTLDSLVVGEDGLGKTPLEMHDRITEAMLHIVRPGADPQHPFATQQERDEEYRAMLNSYLQEKYGWAMTEFQLDLRDTQHPIDPEVERDVVLFCKRHKVALVRLL